MNHPAPTDTQAEIVFGSHKMIKDADGEWVQVAGPQLGNERELVEQEMADELGIDIGKVGI